MLNFTGNISTPTASVTTAKCVFNSVVSTPGARCLLNVIKHFYLKNILPDPEFMRIPLKIIPQEIIYAYYVVNNPVGKNWCVQPRYAGRQTRVDIHAHRKGNVWTQTIQDRC